MNDEANFEKWVLENKLDTLLKPEELFGLSEEFTDLLLYDWTISERKGVEEVEEMWEKRRVDKWNKNKEY